MNQEVLFGSWEARLWWDDDFVPDCSGPLPSETAAKRWADEQIILTGQQPERVEIQPSSQMPLL